MQFPHPLPQVLQGTRILSLALNLPGPAALLRCQRMGAQCYKLEPLPPAGAACADPMHHYSPSAYAQLHGGIHVVQADLKTTAGQQQLHQLLALSDVLLTSFRPTALRKLGLSWDALHAQYPQLCLVRVLGSSTPDAMDTPGHDLTYQAEAGLTDDGHMPASLFADMAGAVLTSEAVLQCLLQRARDGYGHCHDVGLAQAAHWLALPRQWQLTTPSGDIGGAHAGYRLYRCQDGWVAAAALEPHFAQRLCALAGVQVTHAADSTENMRQPQVHDTIGRFLQQHSVAQIRAMATQSDIPLHLISDQHK